MKNTNRRSFIRRGAAAAVTAAAVPATAAAQTDKPVKKVHYPNGRKPETTPRFNGIVSYGNLLFIAGIRAALARTGIDVYVNVDEAWSDVKARRVHHLQGVARIDVGRDLRNFSVRDGDVADRADPVPPVDHVAALQQEVVLLLRREGGNRDYRNHRTGCVTESKGHGFALVLWLVGVGAAREPPLPAVRRRIEC